LAFRYNQPVRPDAAANGPDQSTLEQLLKRYATVRLEVSTALSSGDRAALDDLVNALRWIDRIYWKQRSDEGWAVKQALSASGDPAARALERLVELGYGPWDVFDDDRPLGSAAPRAAGGSLYPADLARDEFRDYLARHPDSRPALESPTTLVRREGGALAGVPYVDVYREELGHVAEALVAASRHVSDPGFATFLASRAHGLVSGSLNASEAQWIDVGDSPIDVAIGPYEVYDDRIAGVKRAYESTVMVRHPMTDELRSLEAIAPELGQRLPGAVAPPRDRQRIVIGVYDVVFAAVRANMGAKPIAAMLPNDEQIRHRVGSRLLLFRNVIAAKFGPILRPVARGVLGPEAAALVDEDVFVFHTLHHELAHALVAGEDVEPSPQETDGLRERYSTLEECRADLVGLVFLQLLCERGHFAAGMLPAAAVTFIGSVLRGLRFGAQNDYARAGAIILSSFERRRAVYGDGSGRLAVDTTRVFEVATELARRVQRIVQARDYDAAGVLIDECGRVPPLIRDRFQELHDVPIDLAFEFDESLLRG